MTCRGKCLWCQGRFMLLPNFLLAWLRRTVFYSKEVSSSTISNFTLFLGPVKSQICGEKSLPCGISGNFAHSHTCSLPFFGFFSSFLFLSSRWLQGAPHPYSLERSGTVCTLNLFFMHSRERELEQEECCRQDTSSLFLTTFHEFKSPILMDAKGPAAQGVGAGRRKDIF